MTLSQAPTPALIDRIQAGGRDGSLLATAAATLSALLGGVVLVGWALDVPALRSVIPGAVETKANTAVGMIGASVALFLAVTARRPGWVVRALSVFVALLGAATLCEYGLHWDLGIDELLVRDSGAAFNQIKGRMSPYSAVGFIALGCSILGLLHPFLRAYVRFASGLAAAIGSVSLVGYLWSASEIVTDRLVSPVSFNNALALTLLGAGILLATMPIGNAGPVRPRSRLERLVLGGLIPTALFVIVGGGLTYDSAADFTEAAERVAHAQEVLAELGRLSGSLADAESAQTNHVLLGDPSFEAEFRTRADETRRHVITLGRLIDDDATQVLRQQRLASLIAARLRALEGAEIVLREQGENVARQTLLIDLRDGLIQQIRQTGLEMSDAETAPLRARVNEARQERLGTLLSLLGSLAVLTTLFMLLFRSIRREMKARSAVEEDLQQLNASLEQRVAERTRELSFQQAFQRRVIDLNRSFIYAKDREGRFVLVNQALAAALGTTVEALIGKKEVDVHGQADEVQEFAFADLHVIESGQELVIDEEKMTNASGQVRWLRTVKRPILSPDGSATIILGVSNDITERKAAQDEVRELTVDLERRVAARTLDLQESNTELEHARLGSEAASRAKSAFLANMSHEIRTPMNAIIGLTHLMLREARDSLQRDRLAKVGDAARHLLQVINDILDMSKIEAGKLTLNESEFSLDELLLSISSMVSARAAEKGLELIIDTDHLPRRLVGDPVRLTQILINLLSNAVKFTEHGWIRLRAEVLGEEGERLFVRFEVQDTGPGISPERQAMLFTAFEQADNSLSRRYAGTGLGLALSRQLAIAMGGAASVSSVPGEGSTFWVTVQLARGKQAASREEPFAVKGLRALLIDDLPEARSVIADRLEMLGLEVDALSSGVVAIEKVQAVVAAGRPYDVMLIDWRMEPIDGIETLTRLRSLLGDGMPPSILVTASDDAGVATQALAAGFDAVMLKPVTASAVHDSLAMLLSRQGVAVSPAPSHAQDDETLLRARHAGQRVLLVEDNPINREVGEALLSSAALVVETARDGAQAVEMALSRPYALILMDIQMPVMDGLEATRAIRERLGQGTPIVGMTANAFVEDRQACLAAGMNDHIPKPVDPAVMYRTLLKWMPLPVTAGAADVSIEVSRATEAADPAPQQARLQALDGIDVAVALRLVADQWPMLMRLLAIFAKTYRRGAPELVDSTGEDGEALRRWRAACHSMRGALATVGAGRVLQELTALEDRLAALSTPFGADSLGAQRTQVHESLIALVARLDAAL